MLPADNGNTGKDSDYGWTKYRQDYYRENPIWNADKDDGKYPMEVVLQITVLDIDLCNHLYVSIQIY
jgi:hypothetical protein